MNKSIKLLAATGLLAASTLALAQASAPAPAPAPMSAAKKELINKLLTLQQPGLDLLARELVQRPVQPLAQQAGAALQNVAADKREAVGKQLEAELKKFVDESIPVVKASAQKNAPAAIGGLLDERFTEDELRVVIAWMESPVSKKFGAVQPDLQKAMVEKIMAETGPTLDARFKALQGDMTNTLKAAAPASATSAAPSKTAPAASKAAAPVKK
ncbi:MAG TPA: DUF2059 domain-containing protein [Burkholderiaceae bacterium]